MLEKNHSELIKIIDLFLSKNARNKKMQKYVTEYLHDKGLEIGLANKIISMRVRLETLDLDKDKDLFILYTFANGLSNFIFSTEEDKDNIIVQTKDIERLKGVSSFFTSLENKKLAKTVWEKEKSGYPYVFSNMTRVSDDHYIGIISAKRLAQIDSTNDIVYNFNTQRDSRVNIFGIKNIKVYHHKIEEIKERILQGKQFPDTIKINVLRDGDDDIDFKSENGIIGDLTIKSGEMDIFDGFHRKTANTLAIMQNPDLDFNWELIITNLTEKKAKEFMVQINKQTPIKKEYVKTLDKSLFENLTVDFLLDNDAFELAEEIKTHNQELNYSGFTTKAILAEAIKDNYDIDRLHDKKSARRIAEWLVEFFNRISEFIKKGDYSSNRFIFYGYIALSRKLYNTKHWEDKLTHVFENFDFSKENKNLEVLKKSKGIIKLTQQEKQLIYNLFRQL